MEIIIKTIPHHQHRYPTVGDWLFDEKGNLEIRVSDMGNWKYELLVALHELVEVFLCKDAGISQEEVDKFDMEYKGEGEPGDDPQAPYRQQHFKATNIERILATYLGVDWIDYENTLEKLFE